jgi:hypothetical protein
VALITTRGNVGVWICGVGGSLEASFYLVAQVLGAIVAALAAGFLPVMVLSPAASTVTPAEGDVAEPTMIMQQGGDL